MKLSTERLHLRSKRLGRFRRDDSEAVGEEKRSLDFVEGAPGDVDDHR